MPSPPKTWKNDERAVASFFATTRTPLSGCNSGHDTHSDTLSPLVYIEVKRRKKHAACELFFGELSKARDEGKPLVIALKQHHQSDPPWLMVIDPRELFKIAALVRRARRENPCLTRINRTPTQVR